MKVFLAGVDCVGKTAIGACLAQRLGCRFYDLDVEIEKHFGKPIERLRAETLTPYSFRKEVASIVLAKLIESEQNSSFVMALFPSGLMDAMWRILKSMDRVVVVLQDSPENILSRITFFDAESKPLVKTLNDKQRLHYLREIRKDATYFGRTYRRADLTVEIHGLDVEASAAKVERLLRELRRGPLRKLSAMHLFQAVDTIRENAIGTRSSEGADLWSEVLKQIRKEGCFDHRYGAAIEEIIRSLLNGLDDDTAIATWRDTETGMAENADDEELVADCVWMDLEMELLQAIMNLAYDEATKLC